VTVVDATGFQCSFPEPCSYSITLGSDEVVTGKDFGDYSLGTIVVIKDARPDDPQNFEFSRSFGPNFFLDNDTDNALSDTAIFANLTPGSYTVTELAPPSPWQFTSLACVDADGGTTTVDATANIDLDSDETVTCTFTNEKPSGLYAAIKVDKVTNPSHDPQLFDFKLTKPDSSSATFQLSDDSTPYDSGWLAPGSGYRVDETTIPLGWDLTSATCTGTGNSPGSITLVAGENVTCTFTDTKRGTIIVEKKAIGGDDTFSFTTTGGDGLDGSFQITTSGGYGSKTFTGIDTGLTYSVAESPPPGDWVFAGTNCTGSFTVPPGGAVTCTFRNELPTGPPPPPAVGGELYSVDKSALVGPYVAGLLGLLAAVATAVAITRRRRR